MSVKNASPSSFGDNKRLVLLVKREKFLAMKYGLDEVRISSSVDLNVQNNPRR